MTVNTVTGKLTREEFGVVSPHEHIFIDISAFFEERKLRDIENPSTEKVKMEHLGQLNRDPYVLKDNLKMTDYETQVVGLALSKMHELGAERESYPLWVLTGDGSDQAISRPRNKILEKSRITFLQVGARYAGYASTIGRPIVLGKASDEEKALIMAGYTIQKEVIGMMKEGVEARAVAQRHLELVKELGFADYYLYGPFHGKGLMEGEAPWVELDSDYKLCENMTFCTDIFLDNRSKKHGLRTEDVIKVGKDCAENLTNYPREIFEI